MVLKDFVVRISDRVERKYKPRGKKLAMTAEPRTMYSFTLEWKGLMEGADPLLAASYIGSIHKGCMFFAAGDKLGWGYPKSVTFRGHQIVPSTPNSGMYDLVLTALSSLPEAKVIQDEIQSMKCAVIPDPEAPPADCLEIS